MRSLTGYAAVFWDGTPGSEYRLGPDAVERIMPSAFDSSLNGPDDIAAAWNHDMNYLLGSRAAGTLKLSKDAKGLRYEIDYDESDPHHQSVMAKVKRGDVPGSSFSFAIVRENVRRDKGIFIRELFDVRLYELGPVWRPAYSGTSAAARSGAKYGSVRWAIEADPQSVKEFEKRQARLKEIERQQVLDRIFELSRN